MKRTSMLLLFMLIVNTKCCRIEKELQYQSRTFQALVFSAEEDARFLFYFQMLKVEVDLGLCKLLPDALRKMRRSWEMYLGGLVVRNLTTTRNGSRLPFNFSFRFL
jgi:hypothetical protein